MKEKEKELYSKVHVAKSIKFIVEKTSDNNIKLNENDKFSYNLTTILTRDREVVAVNLTICSNSCIIYISKNGTWIKEDIEYIEKIQKYLRSISNYGPISWMDAMDRKDTKTLSNQVIKYCSVKFDSRFGKLKKDLNDGKDDNHIKSFIKYFSKKFYNIDEASRLGISQICCFYYKMIYKNSKIPKPFLKHLKKVGSYTGSLINIINCACNEKYRTLFSHIELHKLNSVITNQPIFSWKNIIQRFIFNYKKYQNFKDMCLDNPIIKNRLMQIYGDIEKLDFENINKRIYLHAEMNIATNIINKKIKTRTFIAVSKKCCYLCELYIKFAQQEGYNIVISGSHKKIYHEWKLPDTTNIIFKSNSLTYIIKELDRIIRNEIESYTDLRMKSNSDEGSVDFNIIEDVDIDVAFDKFNILD